MTSLEIEDGTVQIDATIIAEAFGIAPERLMELMRQGKVTSLSERGIDEDAGSHRLTFFCDNRRLRIVANESGDVVQRSVIDFGDHTLPASARRPGA
jgi:hypothetical protein